LPVTENEIILFNSSGVVYKNHILIDRFMTTKKRRILKWTLLSVLAITITGAFVGYKMYSKPHRNVEKATALAISAEELATVYETNESEANSLYLDKVLEVKGEINEISKNQKGETVIALKGSDMSSVRCTIGGVPPVEIKPGSSIALKGICTGYLTDVILVRSILQSK
jgi:tRNA_anti-like